MIHGVHHFAIIVSSLSSIDFYGKLGFQEFKRIERHYDTVVLMSGYGMELEMFVDPSHGSRPKPEPLGLRHLALRVNKIEDTAEELGLEIGPIMVDWCGVRFAFCTDPDGNTVELHE